MTNDQFLAFGILFIIGPVYQRIKFAVDRKSFYKIALRKKSGLQIHHGHWGFAWICLSALLLAFGIHTVCTIGLLGFGLGLALDEIIPALRMPSVGREKELEVYADSEGATFVLLCLVLGMLMCLYQG